MRTILVRRADASDDLITHELCHLWQLQHRPVHMIATYLTTRYRSNPYEREARGAVELTRYGSDGRVGAAGADGSSTGGTRRRRRRGHRSRHRSRRRCRHQVRHGSGAGVGTGAGIGTG